MSPHTVGLCCCPRPVGRSGTREAASPWGTDFRRLTALRASPAGRLLPSELPHRPPGSVCLLPKFWLDSPVFGCCLLRVLCLLGCRSFLGGVACGQVLAVWGSPSHPPHGIFLRAKAFILMVLWAAGCCP